MNFKKWQLDASFSNTKWCQIKSDEYKSFIARQDVQTLFWSFLHLTLFEQSKFWISKNDNYMQVFRTLNDVKSKGDEYQSFITHRDVQILFRPLYHLRKWLQYLVQIWQTPHIVS
jgi:hypothetical protein